MVCSSQTCIGFLMQSSQKYAFCSVTALPRLCHRADINHVCRCLAKVWKTSTHSAEVRAVLLSNWQYVILHVLAQPMHLQSLCAGWMYWLCPSFHHICTPNCTSYGFKADAWMSTHLRPLRMGLPCWFFFFFLTKLISFSVWFCEHTWNELLPHMIKNIQFGRLLTEVYTWFTAVYSTCCQYTHRTQQNCVCVSPNRIPTRSMDKHKETPKHHHSAVFHETQ